MAHAEIIIADEPLLPEAVEIYNHVFRPARDVAWFKRHLLGKYNALTLIARIDEKPVGIWLGYENKPGLFHHWIGAVLPDYRRRGVAHQLQEAEHSWAREHGYPAIRAEAMNRQREFVSFAIQTGFDIVGLRYESERADNVIVLEKNLEDNAVG